MSRKTKTPLSPRTYEPASRIDPARMSLCHQRTRPEPLRLHEGEYRCADHPEVLVRMGLARFDDDGKVQAIRGSPWTPSRRMSGIVAIRVSRRTAINSDARFRAALDRVVTGKPCPDFSPPLATDRGRPLSN